ncbi:FHA domain-containing protein [Propioniciclava tarda]|uniref:FHA domain-containing protein n=1 Tax=Propioniciclava tarda TaxID=433330 RepID=A0A4Q9KPN9_PROTD|nr:FHA domain-containing protein [Propioniciclava tarda]TBT95990.1 FHA domain-containing protein [Propioniciclava tarda]SMO42596.1 zinc-ribbon domain-containing protein [Propioniciclava tarda]HQA30091.1 FHA domain-containing protein [Propioniciclava tarda]HQD59799.1 FHA domain-containing protein [Propioniciclava tarda]
MTCPECGQQLPDTVNFCSNCGAALKSHSGDTTRVIPAIPSEDQVELTEAQLEALADIPRGVGLLLVVRGPNEGTKFVLDTDTVTAGRHPQCDIFLDDVTVSRHHAKLTNRAGHSWITDLNSLNGTYVNRSLIEGDSPLKRGDEVQIGKFRMLYLVDPAGQD